jgi:hypothetical protein
MCAMKAEDRLSQSLRELAAESPSGLPPEARAHLEREFYRYHRRRRIRVAGAGIAAGCLLALLLPFAARSKRPSAAPSPNRPSAPVEQPAAANPASAQFLPMDRGLTAADSSEFVALPSYDPAIPIDAARVVRLQIPGHALGLIGIPIGQEAGDRQFVADVLIAQDGRPYAFRLVEQ